MNNIIIPFVVTTLLFSTVSYAENYYTWRDSTGQTHITNRKPTGDVSKEQISVRHYSQEKTVHRRPSETFQQRVYDQIDSVNSNRYNELSAAEQQRKREKKRFKKTIAVEKKMLKERIHYYKFDCASINDPTRHKDRCDGYQKLYEKKLKLLKRDPEEYFMREMR